MKVHILYQTTKTPAGGGNQFLRILDNVFCSRGVRAANLADSDIVLFNSHQFMYQVAAAKKRFPEKPFIHRIDGPMRIYNSMSDKRDEIVEIAASMISDGIIFQSDWSRNENFRLGLHRNLFDTVINNSVDPDIFNRHGKKPFLKAGKTRLIAASWSTNPGKGFDIYDWLDKNLDYSRFEMTFVGNSPVRFSNIKQIAPMNSRKLADELKKHDIFIFASKVEACSNSLLEALHCGLPSVVYNFSSNPEIVGKGGELFESPEDIPECLVRIINNYNEHVDNISLSTIQDVSDKYLAFMEGIYKKTVQGSYKPKKIGLVGFSEILFNLVTCRCYEKIRMFRKK